MYENRLIEIHWHSQRHETILDAWSQSLGFQKDTLDSTIFLQNLRMIFRSESINKDLLDVMILAKVNGVDSP